MTVCWARGIMLSGGKIWNNEKARQAQGDCMMGTIGYE